ncbi:MAG: adenosine deaminase [Desulfuromonas sp. SDB]|nr:MAG: adenosine deaminase [Desulfuromonas sp. SDB]
MGNNEVKIINGNLVDLHCEQIYPARIEIAQGRLEKITKLDHSLHNYLIPGLIDSHVHLESSLLVPSHFAKIAVKHGTVAVLADPHEICNVLGVQGFYYMMDNARQTPFKFYFGVPSCVPVTDNETSGGKISPEDTEKLLGDSRVKFLSEMMNVPGVINKDKEVLYKINAALRLNKPVDGHAPGLRGRDLDKYIKAGITTDHESVSLAEGEEKLRKGMLLSIREGSAAKNFNNLYSLIDKYPEQCMLCTDDLHPDDLIKGHLNSLIKRGLKKGLNLFNLMKAASLNPIKHYQLDVGLLNKGDPADFVVIDNLKNFNILTTYIRGIKVYDREIIHWKDPKICTVNNFNATLKKAEDFIIKDKQCKVKVIEVQDDQIWTDFSLMEPLTENGKIVSDLARDIIKIAVINRYHFAPITLGLVKNFHLKSQALASSIAHDSHNIIAIGTNDKLLAKAVNLIIQGKGGIALVDKTFSQVLPLPLAGLMSAESAERVSYEYRKLSNRINSTLTNPLMTLSFLALIVVPRLKISDKGLFDVDNFTYTSLYNN